MWQRPRRRKLPWLGRAALVLVALAFLAVFVLAFQIDPYKDGKVWLEETHLQLGLAQCSIKRYTGLPCPSCGMTTSFALLVRGDLWHSIQANFAGTLLALAGLALIPWSLASALSGRLVGVRNFEWAFVRLMVGFLILLFVRWGIVLALSVW